MKSIAIFCGSNMGNSPSYKQAALEIADIFIERDITLIYGGAKVGLMGLLADHILKKNGKVVGVIPRSLVDAEVAHEELTYLHVVDSMHTRKALMTELSDAFILFPGGVGSLDEFFEVYTWAKLGFHNKPCGILNINSYYDPIVAMMDNMVADGFIKPEHRLMIGVRQSIKELLRDFDNYQAPTEKPWISPEDSLAATT